MSRFDADGHNSSIKEQKMTQDIIIDKEFKSLLPPLDKETYTLLEKNLLEHGCRDALVTWNNVLIDGYNRYAICTKHGIPFKTVSKEFASRNDVLIWIITNQSSRRNLSPLQLLHYRRLQYNVYMKVVANKKLKNMTSASHLRDQYTLSLGTIIRDKKIATAIDMIGEVAPGAKKKILSGEAKIDRQVLRSLPSWSESEIFRFSMGIENGKW